MTWPRRAATAAALVGATVAATAAPAAAHGVGGRSDLPLPVWLFAYGAGSALLISFVALGLLWPRPRLAAAAAGAVLPSWSRRALDAAGLVARLAVLAAFLLTLAAAAVGTTNSAANLAPVAVYVVFWVGVQAVSALVGPVWPSLSPFDTVAAVVQRLRGRTGAGVGVGLEAPAPLRGATHWPAAAGLLAFAWLELAHHDPASPRLLALALAVYSLAMLAGAARWGRAWLRTGDGFAAWSDLLGALAPLTRDDGGRFRLRPPVAGLADVRPRAGTAAVVLVVLGSTTFDGVTRTTWWLELAGPATGWARTGVATGGLIATIAAVALAYALAMQVAGRVTGRAPAELAAAFLPSLVPIALAYAVAHYFSLFVFEGQQALALVSDPFGRGWDLFGTADHAVDYRALSTSAIAYVQAAAIVVGHVVGVVAAHDRAVELFPRRTAAQSQYALLGVMVLYTVGGLGLLLGA